jgi:hypothetical protein
MIRHYLVRLPELDEAPLKHIHSVIRVMQGVAGFLVNLFCSQMYDGIGSRDERTLAAFGPLSKVISIGGGYWVDQVDYPYRS